MEIVFEAAQPLQNVYVRRKAHGLGNGAKAPLSRSDPSVYVTSVRSFVVTAENNNHTSHRH